jgi:hypothetical protein
VDDDNAPLHRREDRQEARLLRAGAIALTAAAALAAGPPAGAATPAARLAKSLKTSMQAYYHKGTPGLKITTVTCKIAASGATARCHAHFTVKSERAVGVFQVAATIDRSTGGVRTRTLSVTCKDSKTGAKLTC